MPSNKEENKKLIERYPFLMPRNPLTDAVPKDFDYSYSELDAMPDGWLKAFGEQMCEEIREELVRADFLKEYRITTNGARKPTPLDAGENCDKTNYEFGTPKGSRNNS